MIRKAVESDLASVRRCAEAAYAKYVNRIGRKPAPMTADFAAQIDNGSVYVEVGDGGQVRGFAVCYQRADHLHLENVAVHPEHQGQGLGRRLIEWVEDEAIARGYRRVELYTNARMRGNLALYPRLGYHETGRRVEEGFDRVYFSKKLA